ncbi:aspartate-semialdehyde dehydrogenase [Candidatus Karelsulcia muelleri]|uniref:aspartate-semialdehyde dehydrogenase n=1 Tax=Candidatus Karelsulcia muelleri TaxID=336810 RepID=UPI0007F99526|nr:aspartate-semialdehyde dehydrogenase [Candidatus Karelsulcia muelleri]ANO35781.1 aspartate-semialdehyde dehydrogenase [Candidatus Karelsulcia muelleri]QSF25169.1 aspartate-semialdehyde dehydrogenase [Candidatus Karelsulcia muelleri]WKD87256.1 aspartate-semialdehyde dehydrogenase [Candidatus Karelsulcia muelleri]BEH03690.1 aspartate-semialdehyde dehydrogenase [Candidatus Karelsulcia muelleri]
MNLAIVGVTGMVGRVILNLLEEKNISINKLYPVASNKSIGKKIFFRKKKYKILSIEEVISLKPDIAIFSAGAEISKKWAIKFTNRGTILIDNSSAWRMDKYKKLIVPEINGNIIKKKDKIIANPNCSTIQLVMVLHPLYKKYKIKRIVISTYQSVTGSGKKGLDQLINEENFLNFQKNYCFKINRNAIPHCEIFDIYGYSKEELKLINETKKIFNDKNIRITATSVRIPVVGGHSESVNLTFKNDFDINYLRNLLSNTNGLILMDNIKNNIYPMPILCEGNDNVFVGRIRRDMSKTKSLNMWIVSDNLRKGSATNAVQILEYLIHNKFVK